MQIIISKSLETNVEVKKYNRDIKYIKLTNWKFRPNLNKCLNKTVDYHQSVQIDVITWFDVQYCVVISMFDVIPWFDVRWFSRYLDV
jgi:hypothetical protein